MDLLNRAKILEQQGRDVIHMEIGEPDFLTPQPIVDAGMAFLKSGEMKYTPSMGISDLRVLLARYYRDKYSVELTKERIIITPGASGAVLIALGLTIEAGNEVILADPGYPCYRNFIHFFNGISRLIPVTDETNFQLDIALLNQHWGSNTKAVLLASPSNPTGTMISSDQLGSLIQRVEEQNGCFFSDEIYHGLEYGDKAETALAFSNNVFVINSFSKFFGMTGWRIGWLIVPEFCIEAANTLAQNIFIATSTVSQYAALEAFCEQNITELETRRCAFKERRDFLYTALQQIGFKLGKKPAGGFYLYANCEMFTTDSFQFAQDLLEIKSVAVTPGKDFGDYLAHQHVRFAYTTPLEKLQEGVNRIRDFVNNS